MVEFFNDVCGFYIWVVGLFEVGIMFFRFFMKLIEFGFEVVGSLRICAV